MSRGRGVARAAENGSGLEGWEGTKGTKDRRRLRMRFVMAGGRRHGLRQTKSRVARGPGPSTGGYQASGLRQGSRLSMVPRFPMSGHGN